MNSFKIIALTGVILCALFVLLNISTYHTHKPDHSHRNINFKNQKTAYQAFQLPHSAGAFYWKADHENGSLEEYSWWKTETVPTGTLKVITDPTGAGRGYVLSGEVTSGAIPANESHRLYPALMLPDCYRGPYSSVFHVWSDLPLDKEHGWFSFATYTNRKEWQDLFGVNLGEENGESRLILFHVPVVGKGDFTRISPIPFPMKQWVKIEVSVDSSGIMLLQDDRLVAEAKKTWGREGPGLCEAHWGMYAQGKNSSGVILNDDVSITFEQPFDMPPRKIRESGGKHGNK